MLSLVIHLYIQMYIENIISPPLMVYEEDSVSEVLSHFHFHSLQFVYTQGLCVWEMC